MSKTPRGNLTPNPIARGLFDFVPCIKDGVRAIEVVREVVYIVNGRGILD
jgi:hypothetical protein